MMRQALNPKMPKFGKALKNNSGVLEKELIYQLESRSKTAVMLSDAKKSFLKELLKNKKEIIEHCESFDGIIASSLAPSIKKLIPTNVSTIDKTNNSDLSIIVAKILPPLRVLRSNIISKYNAETKRKGNLRTSTKTKQHRTVVLKILDEANQVLEDLEAAVYANRGSLSFSNLCKPIKLTDIQRQRKWIRDLVPKQAHLQKCPLCDHDSTNYPPENETIAKDNRKKELEFSSKIKKWDQYMKDKNNGKAFNAPEGMTRRPYRRDFKEPIIMCMCATSYCLGEFDTAADSCPIKCLRPAPEEQKAPIVKLETGTGASYTSSNSRQIKNEPWVSSASEKPSQVDDCSSSSQSKTIGAAYVSDPIRQVRYKFSGIPKACECPICRCRCNFACVVSDVPKIMHKRRMDNFVKMAPKTHGVEASDYSASSPGFLGNIMSDAIKIGWKTMKNEGKNMAVMWDNSGIDDKTEMYVENRGVSAACEEAATAILCKSSSLPMEEKMKYRDLIGGKPTTDVLLPSGDRFSTKSLIGSNKHSKNNRLGVSEELHDGKEIGSDKDVGSEVEVIGSYKPMPGMRTNLEIDWSNQSNEFVKFLQLKSTMNDINDVIPKRTAKRDKKKSTTKPPPTQFVKIERKPSDDSSSMILNQDQVEVFKSSKEKSLQIAFNDMHDRILVKTKSQLTAAINNRIKDKSNETAKEQVLELKNVIAILQQSERDGTHLDTIRNVTNDGKDICDTSSLNSEDVLERVKVYHDI